MLEEACAQVLDARLLGFARVEVLPWEPQFEIPLRRLVPTGELRMRLWTEPGYERFYQRVLLEGALL